MENYFCVNSVEEQVDYLTDKVKDIITNKLDKASIVQETGTGTDVVMSQKAVTDAIANKGLDTLTNVDLTLGNTTVQYDTTNGIQLNSVARFTGADGNHDATMELDLPIVGKDGIVIDKAADSEKIEVSGKNFIKDPYPGVNVTGAGIVNYKPINSSDWGNAFIRNTHSLVNNAGHGAIVGYDNVGVIYAKTTSDDPWSVVNKEYADNNFLKVYDRGIIGLGSVIVPVMRRLNDTANEQKWFPTCVGEYVANSAIALTDAHGHLGTNTPIADKHCANKKYVDDAIASISSTTQTKYQHNLVLEGTEYGFTFTAFMSIFRSNNDGISALDEVVAALGDAYISCTGYLYDGNQKSYSIIAFNASGPVFKYNDPETGGQEFAITNDDVAVTDNVLEF